MTPTFDPDHLERRLAKLPLVPAPERLWQDVQNALARPVSRWDIVRRPVRSPLLAVAAGLVALVAGTYAGLRATFDAPSRWEVVALSGAPTLAGSALASAGNLETGEHLSTDSGSRARLTVGRIGTALLGPNSSVRLDRSRGIRHRLTLERGSLDAVIEAPPRLFFVQTPSALATDLGCAYTLEVDDQGNSRLHVTAGWVELAEGGRVSLVAAGLVAEVKVGGSPGTPYPVGIPDAAVQALHRLDQGNGNLDDLETLIAELHNPADFITIRQESAITLWHLLQRLDGPLRTRVYERLAELSAPPARVTREGILALKRPMLERWRRDLNPMWSEEAQPTMRRLARRMWDLLVR